MKKKKKQSGFKKWFEKTSAKITRLSGSPYAVLIAVSAVVIWGITGPVFHYSDTWQLVINTSTTIITFIMVFVIQHSQNKDTVAMQIKLNELIAVNEEASNRVVDIEELTEEELQVLKKYYTKLALLSKVDHDIFSSHSVDEAEENTKVKSKPRKPVSKNGTSPA